ncbi:hypothetical protein Acsp04_24260 [Actinomadura sp. NBRC 104425]|uniref:hypothetical protein n=1 Tax=Actinomadura sp. NBRC 104425 TaxID=3032204 RepID=UPI00249FB9C8|nr:hypothetical protein [Actinomadura sp. NBRC 104425]GLZ12191.1 hypothetical protein Acsp04_24260 [Actinomadura sp. NBRC 104425]
MNRDDHWRLVEDARAAVPADDLAVAEQAAALRAERPRTPVTNPQQGDTPGG